MSYFKYNALNSLRDELWLTMTRQKATMFLFLYLAIPIGGLGLGILWSAQAHSPLRMITGSAIGFASGAVLAWLLPLSLWNLLRLFSRMGWFLRSERPGNVSTMPIDEFVGRSNALRLAEMRSFRIWALLLIANASCCWWLCAYIERTDPKSWIQGLAGCSILAIFVGMFLWRRRAAKSLVRKHGLNCPTCGREITDAAGLSRVPDKGLCRNCGTRVIEREG